MHVWFVCSGNFDPILKNNTIYLFTQNLYVHFQLNGDAPETANVESSDVKNGKAPKRNSSGKAAETKIAKVPKKSSPEASDSPVIDAKSVYDFTVKDTFGNEVPLSKYKGKVLLFVNIASRCGHTKKNYEGLNQLQEQYKNKGKSQRKERFIWCNKINSLFIIFGRFPNFVVPMQSIR